MSDLTYADVKRALRSAYDARADARDTMADQAWKQPERERFRDLLRAAGATSLLEIGAGHGVSGRFFEDEGFEVLCVDLAPELVARCRAKGLAAQVMDFSALTLPASSVDAVFGMNCLLHVPGSELDGVLGSIRAVLAGGGLFYWGQYGRAEPFEGIYPDDGYEPKRFFSFLTDQQIQRAAARHFEVVDFGRVPLDGDHWGYQALVLRRPPEPATGT